MYVSVKKHKIKLKKVLFELNSYWHFWWCRFPSEFRPACARTRRLRVSRRTPLSRRASRRRSPRWPERRREPWGIPEPRRATRPKRSGRSRWASRRTRRSSRFRSSLFRMILWLWNNMMLNLSLTGIWQIPLQKRIEKAQVWFLSCSTQSFELTIKMGLVE